MAVRAWAPQVARESAIRMRRMVAAEGAAHEGVPIRLPLLHQPAIGHLSELERDACIAADGHWHKAAAHDAPHANTKMAVGHFYSLSLRTHRLTHLATGKGLHEHDMSALKRVKPRGCASKHLVPTPGKAVCTTAIQAFSSQSVSHRPERWRPSLLPP